MAAELTLGLLAWAWALLLYAFARHCAIHVKERKERRMRDLFGDWSNP